MNKSIVLSTYNGSKYIKELLDSLRLQTSPADEVLICDDCSNDNTLNIINEYILNYQLETWKVVQNSSNIGWKANFVQSIFKATGDVIFTCDQDDIWKLDKIEKMCHVLDTNKDILLLCSDYEILYMENSTRFPKVYVSKMSNDKRVEKVTSEKAYFVVDRPGCTYALRKELIPYMKKLWFEDYAHDALAWRAAFINDSLYIFHYKAITFRRHSSNASDYKRNSIASRIVTCDYFVSVIQGLIGCLDERKDISKIKYLNKCLKLQNNRKSVLEQRSFLRWLVMFSRIGLYPRYSTYFADGLSILKKEKDS